MREGEARSVFNKGLNENSLLSIVLIFLIPYFSLYKCAKLNASQIAWKSKNVFLKVWNKLFYYDGWIIFKN